jgi:hypothetical protein
MELFVEELRGRVLTAVTRAYSQLRDSDPADPLSIDVSYDGTWMTRGHRSHVGAAFVIDCETGFVIDYEVISNFCEVCFKKEKSVSPPDFAAWKVTHTNCKKNFDGKSGAMETEAARRMWSRSEALGYRYTTFVGDGDSSAFNAVKALNGGAGPYPVPVVKEECVNHVCKRLGTRLRNLKKDLRRPVTTKTGKIIQRSLHSKLWLKCAKVKNSQLQRVQFAAADTVMIHNFGDARGSLLGRMGMSTEATKARCVAKDSATPPRTPRPPKRRRVDGGDQAAAGPSADYVPGGH